MPTFVLVSTRTSSVLEGHSTRATIDTHKLAIVHHHAHRPLRAARVSSAPQCRLPQFVRIPQPQRPTIAKLSQPIHTNRQRSPFPAWRCAGICPPPPQQQPECVVAQPNLEACASPSVYIRSTARFTDSRNLRFVHGKFLPNARIGRATLSSSTIGYGDGGGNGSVG